MKHILITGASSGIGESLANAYATPTTRLFLSGRDAERLKLVADACRSKGAIVEEHTINVCDRYAMAQWIHTIADTHGLDLVIANAGISGGFDGQSLDRITDDYKIFDTNLNGVLNTIYPALPSMITRQSGHIVIISSLASFIPMPSAPAYAASKAAVRFYGEALATKLKPHNIAVTVICPGFIKSRMTDKNSFPMPFLMETDTATRYIIRKIGQKTHRVIFPWPMSVMIKTLSILPAALTHAIFAWLPDKKSLPKK